MRRTARSLAVVCGLAATSALAAASDTTYLTDFVVIPTDSPPAADAAHVARLATKSAVRDSKQKCKGNGDVSYAVTGGIDGAFTKPGAKERVYVVTYEQCVAPGPGVEIGPHTPGIAILTGPRSQLVVMRGSAVVANLPIDENAIVVAKDLDGDGVAEVLLARTTTFMRETAATARMVTLRDGKVQVIRDFGDVITSCGLAAPATRTTVSYKLGDHGLELAAATKPRDCR